MSTSTFPLQPLHLKNELISLIPLKQSDFERLYQVASDPELWAQHPNKNRYQRPVFENFFKGAIESGGAFLILDEHEQPIGSSRFYDFNPTESSILIGYTFLAKSCWGIGYNNALKKLMLDYAFQSVDQVIFHVGSTNIPSQKAMAKLGAIKSSEIEVAYYGEPVRKNIVYHINKMDWNKASEII